LTPRERRDERLGPEVLVDVFADRARHGAPEHSNHKPINFI
jgi:hypothetical protein